MRIAAAFFEIIATRAEIASRRPFMGQREVARNRHQRAGILVSAGQGDRAFNLQEYGNTYSRIMNPTVAAFEER
ncbi:MAG: hypothetical protein AAF408_13060, partial [Pseudomonadota bacterium]